MKMNNSNRKPTSSPFELIDIQDGEAQKKNSGTNRRKADNEQFEKIRDEPIFLTVKEAAEIGKCSCRKVRDLLASGRVSGTRIGTHWRVHTSSWYSYLGLI